MIKLLYFLIDLCEIIFWIVLKSHLSCRRSFGAFWNSPFSDKFGKYDDLKLVCLVDSPILVNLWTLFRHLLILLIFLGNLIYVHEFSCNFLSNFDDFFNLCQINSKFFIFIIFFVIFRIFLGVLLFLIANIHLDMLVFQFIV